MRTPRSSDLVLGGLVIWTVVATVLIARLEYTRTARASATGGPIVTYIRNWKELADRGYPYGPSTAATTIVVFSDFQCPYCRRFALVIDSLRARRPDVRIVERHFPLAGHDAAFDAALAAECSRDAGHYEQMRTAIFRDTVLVAGRRWAAIAATAGIKDSASLAKCVADKRHAGEVRADMKVGNDIGVQGTPSFLINDSLYRGAMGLEAMERHLQRKPGG